jgi:hypothetical protein
MSRDTKNIIELGVFCGVCVILLNFFLARFDVLIWPALVVTFIVFAILVVDSLTHLTATPRLTFHADSRPQVDELTRLRESIERSISEHETQPRLMEKLRTVGLSVASARMNLSKECFCELTVSNPGFVAARLNDNVLIPFLSGKKLNLTAAQEIHDVLSRIERL